MAIFCLSAAGRHDVTGSMVHSQLAMERVVSDLPTAQAPTKVSITQFWGNPLRDLVCQTVPWNVKLSSNKLHNLERVIRKEEPVTSTISTCLCS